jgi:hypothetical protein
LTACLAFWIAALLTVSAYVISATILGVHARQFFLAVSFRPDPRTGYYVEYGSFALEPTGHCACLAVMLSAIH